MMSFPKLVYQYRQQKPDLRHRMVYTVLLLLLFRLLALVPALNVDEERLHQLLAHNPLIGTVDLFAGGEVMAHFSIMAAGIFPYLLAVMLAQGATYVVPPLHALRRAGERGQKRIELYARLLTIPLAFVFAWGISQYLSQQTGLFPGHIQWFTAASFFPSLRVVCLVTAGSLASTAITAVITQLGIGDGKDMILLVSSVLVFAHQLIRVVRESSRPVVALQRLGLITLVALLVLLVTIYLLQAVRRVPVLYANRIVPGRRLRPPALSLPLPFNRGGILPVSAATGLLALLQLLHDFLQSHFAGRAGAVLRALTAWATPGNGLYWLAVGCLVMIFIYTFNFNLILQPYSNANWSLAEEMRRNNSFIPGVRPGLQTEAYLARIMARITLFAGLGLVFLSAVLPYAILRLTQQNVIVTILTLIVASQAFAGVRNRFNTYQLMDSYESLLPPRKKSSRWKWLN